jgi:hypothetical protein
MEHRACEERDLVPSLDEVCSNDSELLNMAVNRNGRNENLCFARLEF